MRLLLAARLGLGGVLAQITGGLPQGAGGLLQLVDNPAQLGGEGVEVLGQFGDFILAVGIEAAGQVAFTAGDIGHGVDGFLQRPNDAAGDHHDQ
ncbi:hypothetical protein D3C85_1592400 [compost metagenome]